jgi:hypothetical protein
MERGAVYEQEKLQTCSAKHVSFEKNKEKRFIETAHKYFTSMDQ